MKDPEPSTLDLKITDSSLLIKGKSSTSDESYELNINFFKEIDSSSVRKTITGSHIFFIIVKKDLNSEFWPRLTSEKVKYRNIRTDFDKWVDEDEQDEKDDSAMDQMAGMEGMGGMPGMEGMGDMSELLKGMGGGAGGAGGLPDLQSFSKNNLDFSELAKQFGGKGDAGAGKSGPSQFGDFSEANYSSSGNEEEDGDDDESHSHGHSHSHAQGDEDHSHSHSH